MNSKQAEVKKAIFSILLARKIRDENKIQEVMQFHNLTCNKVLHSEVNDGKIYKVKFKSQ